MHLDFEMYTGSGNYIVMETLESEPILEPWFSSSFDFAKIDFWNRLNNEQKEKYKNCLFQLC